MFIPHYNAVVKGNWVVFNVQYLSTIITSSITAVFYYIFIDALLTQQPPLTGFYRRSLLATTLQSVINHLSVYILLRYGFTVLYRT